MGQGFGLGLRGIYRPSQKEQPEDLAWFARERSAVTVRLGPLIGAELCTVGVKAAFLSAYTLFPHHRWVAMSFLMALGARGQWICVCVSALPFVAPAGQCSVGPIAAHIPERVCK